MRGDRARVSPLLSPDTRCETVSLQSTRKYVSYGGVVN